MGEGALPADGDTGTPQRRSREELRMGSSQCHRASATEAGRVGSVTAVRRGPATDGDVRSSAGRRGSGEHPRTSGTYGRSKLQGAVVATMEDKDVLASAAKSDIHTVKVLGEGAFGIVDLVVVDTPRGSLLCVRKKLLKQNNHGNNADPEQEVDFMEHCNGSHFVVQLWSHVVGLYDYTLLLEYCPYNTLQHLLDVVNDTRSKSGNGCWDFLSISVLRMGHQAGLREDEARFYTACVALGLQSMHSKGVMHRDLKPSNCLVGHNRYVKVADLGLAKNLGKDGKGYTKAGTPGYMSPEIFHTQGKSSGGYGYPADLWSLGVMLWEMVDGALPKWAPMSWYWTTLHFPDHFSKELKSLLTGLLDKAPETRMTIDKMKRHAWFAGFDWDALARQELTAPNPPELHRVHIHLDLLPESARPLALSQNAAKYSS